ncbi:hypothetical protein GCM10017708_11530 [Arthrobacter citreus]
MAGGGKYPMTILHDDGVYRHLRFDKPKDQGFNEPFHIITWPGRLTIAGGHGTYTFARMQDMFEFFTPGPWSINPGYWGEKLEAIDKNAGYREYDPAIFKEWLLQDFWERRTEYPPNQAREIWEDLRYQLFAYDEDSDGDYARGVLDRFNTNGFEYDDLWEVDWDGYTSHYLWSLHAIVWGIRQYRAAKATLPEGATGTNQEPTPSTTPEARS